VTGDPELRDRRIGLAAGLGAFSIWGLAPVYFKQLAAVRADEIIAHRVVWSVLFLGFVLLFRKRGAVVAHLRLTRREFQALCLTSLLISANWLLFVHAVNTDRILATSLGYFINPLMSVVLGLLVFRERLVPAQTLAVLIAAAGTAYMAWRLGQVPWISLTLAGSFAAYGVIRKLLNVGPMVGLFWETLIISPLALVWLWRLGQDGVLLFDLSRPGLALLLAGTGILTVAPLLLFAAGVKRIALTTIGLLQYLAPSITFILAIFVYGEAFTMDHAITFGLVWLGLILFFWASWQRVRPA
jgi:chloramphenicol-sensitive protein RarD